ncbi:MAG TPA: VTT domain-containing protein [Bryobacteraceae bacterium]|nr:VTT domain-containing protein [Bryobacteraceae bacterium]
MLRHLTDALVALGPAGILLLSILDSSGVPVAGVFDALLILIAVQKPSVAWLCASMAVIGSTVGNSALFWAARKGGRRFMDRAAPEGRAAKFRTWFRRYGMVTVFVPALVPIPMPLKLFVISAGVLGTSRTEFVLVVLVARILRYFGEAWLGVTLGRESSRFLTTHALHFLLGAILLAALLYGFILWRDRRVPNDHPL